MFQIADEFRRRGRLVCMGGPICNVAPEDCRPHCDVLFEGEGEYTWKQFLAEWQEGRHADHYIQQEKVNMRDSPPPAPLAGKQYAALHEYRARGYDIWADD